MPPGTLPEMRIRRNDAEMGLANSLHASAWYSEYNERFHFIGLKRNPEQSSSIFAIFLYFIFQLVLKLHQIILDALETIKNSPSFILSSSLVSSLVVCAALVWLDRRRVSGAYKRTIFFKVNFNSSKLNLFQSAFLYTLLSLNTKANQQGWLWLESKFIFDKNATIIKIQNKKM